MKLNVTLDGRAHAIDLPARRSTSGSSVISAIIDDAPHEVTLHAAPASDAAHDTRTYLLTHNGRVHECRVRRTSAGEYEIALAGRTFSAQVSAPRRLPVGGAAATGASGGRARITAPMPGKIVRVIVEQGAQVRAGESIIVVEAMKMQNEMKAPRDGTIVELHATSGATVAAGDVLAVIE